MLRLESQDTSRENSFIVSATHDKGTLQAWTGSGGRGYQFDVVLRMEPIHVNGLNTPDIGPVPVPPGAQETTLDEVRKLNCWSIDRLQRHPR
jgi:hypothetical protein